MANDRVYLRCQKCGGIKLLAKYWGDGFALRDAEPIEDFLLLHQTECHSLTHDLEGKVGFDLIVETAEDWDAIWARNRAAAASYNSRDDWISDGHQEAAPLD